MQEPLLSKNKGWTLIEALERTTCADLWQQYVEAKKAYETSLVPKGSDIGGYLVTSPEKKRKLFAEQNTAFQRLVPPFRQLFLDERLFSWGSKETGSTHPTAIYSGGWKSIACNFDKNRIKDRSGAGTVFHDVRVFPLAFDSSFEARLNGLSLIDAFRQCLLDDPEVVAIHSSLTSDGIVETDQHFPDRYLHMKWPVTQSANGLALSFVRGPAIALGGREAVPSELDARQADVTCSRWAALMKALASGSLIAKGTFVATGVSHPIDRHLWSRSGLFVDTKNGDLISDDTYPKPTWVSIELSLRSESLPITISAVEAPSSSQVRLARRKKKVRSPYPKPKTPVEERILLASKKLWPRGVPKVMQKQIRNQEINNQLKKLGLPRVSDRSISRYLERKRK